MEDSKHGMREERREEGRRKGSRQELDTPTLPLLTIPLFKCSGGMTAIGIWPFGLSTCLPFRLDGLFSTYR